MSTQFGFNCPAGGQWYACGTGTSRFVGCCASDPCSTGCSQGNIRPGAYNATMHGKYPDASCGTASNFYTCGFGKTFWGCCKTNACSATPGPACDGNNLVPAFMERPEQFAAYAPNSKQSSSPSPEGSSSNGGLIGGVIGGILGLLIIVGLLVFFFLRRRRNKQQSNIEATATASTPMMKSRPEERFSEQYGQSPPPMYTSPNPNIYQNVFPSKDHPYHQPYQQYSHQSAEPQELPVEMSAPHEQRYSELPGEASGSNSYRLSELPVGARGVTAELESPRTSPRPLQSEFSTDMAKQANQANQFPPAVSEGRSKGKD